MGLSENEGLGIKGVMKLTYATTSLSASEILNRNRIGKGGARELLEPSEETSCELVK